MSFFSKILPPTIVCGLFIWLSLSEKAAFFESFSRDVLFIGRDYLGFTPGLDPRIKIYTFDDRTAAYLKGTEMDLNDWSQVIKAFAKAGPQSIIIDKMFGEENSAEFATRFNAELKSVDINLIAATYFSDKEITYATPLTSSQKSVFSSGRISFNSINANQHFLYGPEPKIASSFSKLGFTNINEPFGSPSFYAPFVQYQNCLVSHLALANSKINGRGAHITINDHLLSLNKRGLLPINVLSPTSYQDRARSLQPIISNARKGLTIKNIEPDDIVLILPLMYTGAIHYTPTALGLIPIEHRTTAILNDALSGIGLTEWNTNIALTVFLILLSTVLAIQASLLATSISTISVCIIIYAWSQVAVIYQQQIFPWLYYACAIFLSTFLSSFVKIRHQQIEAEKLKFSYEKVLSTLSTLAHDLLKPLSLTEVFINNVGAEKHLDNLPKILASFTPSIKSAISYTGQMLENLLAADKNKSQHPQHCDVATVLVQVLQDVFWIHKSTAIEFEFKLNSSAVFVDGFALKRIFFNIIDNAVSAMNCRGKIWVYVTRPAGSTNCLIEVGNTNSFIAATDIQHLFEPFFTKNKSKGTGLGLAIVKDLVEANQGHIKCESSATNGTRFIISLKASDAQKSESVKLPTDSQSLTRGLIRKSEPRFDQGINEIRNFEVQLQKVISNDLKKASTKLKIMFVDEDRDYLKTISGQFSHFDKINDKLDMILLEFKETHSLQSILDHNPAMLFIAADLGGVFKRALEFVGEVRAAGFENFICLNSLFSTLELYDIVRMSGADAFLPKPMSKIQILNFIREQTSPEKEAHVAVIDDDPFMLECWANTLQKSKASLFSSPELFWNFLEESNHQAIPFDMVITDYYFDESKQTGADICRKLKELGFDQVLISSDRKNIETEADLVMISKNPLSYEKLRQILNYGKTATKPYKAS